MVHVYLTAQDLHKVRQSQPNGVTNAEWMLRAVESQHAAVKTILREPPSAPTGSLFNTSAYQRKATGERRQYGARLRDSDISTIRDLVSGLHGVSMSAFIAACLLRHAAVHGAGSSGSAE